MRAPARGFRSFPCIPCASHPSPLLCGLLRACLNQSRRGRAYVCAYTHTDLLRKALPLLVESEPLRLDLAYTGYSLFFLVVQFTNLYRFNLARYDLDVLFLCGTVPFPHAVAVTVRGRGVGPSQGVGRVGS